MNLSITKKQSSVPWERPLGQETKQRPLGHSRLNKVERMGSGYKRIREYLGAAGLPFPEIESGSFFIVTFKRPAVVSSGTKEETKEKTKEETKEKTLGKILAAIKANPAVTTLELMKLLSLSDSGVEWNLRKLKSAGLLKRVGSTKGGHWEVVSR